MTITGTRIEKIRHYAKISIVHLLVFTAIAGVLYGHMQTVVAGKEKETMQVKITNLENELQSIKK